MLTAVTRLWPRWPTRTVLRGSTRSAPFPTSFETFVKKIATFDLEPRILESMRTTIQTTSLSDLRSTRLSALGLLSREQRLRFAHTIEDTFGIRFGSTTREHFQRNCTLEFVFKRTVLFYRTQRAA